MERCCCYFVDCASITSVVRRNADQRGTLAGGKLEVVFIMVDYLSTVAKIVPSSETRRRLRLCLRAILHS